MVANPFLGGSTGSIPLTIFSRITPISATESKTCACPARPWIYRPGAVVTPLRRDVSKRSGIGRSVTTVKTTSKNSSRFSVFIPTPSAASVRMPQRPIELPPPRDRMHRARSGSLEYVPFQRDRTQPSGKPPGVMAVDRANVVTYTRCGRLRVRSDDRAVHGIAESGLHEPLYVVSSTCSAGSSHVTPCDSGKSWNGDVLRLGNLSNLPQQRDAILVRQGDVGQNDRRGR